MKVLDLQCGAAGHRFEGWFSSEDDFQNQLGRGLVQCPICASSAVQKMPSAPRLNLGTSAQEAGRPPAVQASQPAPAATSAVMANPQLQAAWLELARNIVARTEDVGERFAEEARRMHYGEIDERAIRGQATARETAQLLDEGIEVLPLLLPPAAKETLQ